MTDRWKRIIPPVAGVLVVAASATGISLGNTPDSGSSGAKVLAYVESHHGRLWLQTFLFAYTSVLAVVFYTGMGSYLRQRGSDVLATLTVVGGALAAVGLGLGAGANAALADKTRHITPAAAQALNQISEDIFFIVLFGGVALATMAIGVSILRTQAMPKVLGIITVVVAVVGFSGIGSWFAFMAMGPLTLALAWFLYQRTGQPESVSMPDVPGQRAAVETAADKAKA